MSYQVLARKWRPQKFADVIGQEHVLRALINALEQQRLHHAYLFTGTRGVGKTTLARILARCLNCETGITAEPCGECSACREISEGRFVDLIEVDAASRTKVEDTRDLLDNVQYAPTRGRYKIYLIDEVHMLSTHSFNALLKTLEEPPEHVKFLLATTDPQKLPVTVLSRCLQFNLKNLSAAQIVGYLEHILAEEKIEADNQALWLLATAAAGSMRDALSLTDQAIAHGEGKLSESEVASMLGTVDQTHIHQLVEALIAGDGQALLQQCAELAELAVDYQSLIDQLLALVHRIAVAQTVPAAGSDGRMDDHKVAEYAAGMQPEDVQLYYQMLLMGRRDLSFTPDLSIGFEMLMLRLHAYSPLVQQAAESAQEKKPLAPTDGAERSPGSARQVKITLAENPHAESVPSASHAEETDMAEPASSPPADELADEWIGLFETLELDGMLRTVCSHLSLEERDSGVWIFHRDAEGAGIFSDKHRDQLELLLSQQLGSAIRVEVKASANKRESPAQRAERLHREQIEKAKQALLGLPVVQNMISELDGTLMPDSIRIDGKSS